MNQRVLIIEDDEALGAQIASQLRDAGYQPHWLRDGRSATDDAAQAALVLLDIMLPEQSGLDILRSIRRTSDVPVMMLSARTDTFDRVRALRLGADDYLTKPFWPEELIERVKARLRRPVMQRSEVLDLGRVQIDLAAHTVYVDGAAVPFTAVELRLLSLLGRRAGAAVTRAALVEHALDPDREGGERTLDVHISRLRKKLGNPDAIQTVWGIGYRMVRSE